LYIDKKRYFAQNISDDIKGAKVAFYTTILVKTGVYKTNDETKYCNISPDVLADDFANAVRILLCAQSKYPRLTAEDKEEALRRAQMQSDKDFFSRRMAAYDESDCNRKRRFCPPKIPSKIW
jgi:hypothetical protein